MGTSLYDANILASERKLDRNNAADSTGTHNTDLHDFPQLNV
jgi:hypothetical protein